MTSSKQTAGVVGPILAAVTLSEIVNPGVWVDVTAPVTYQAGLLAFVAGYFIVRAHNRWTLDWSVTITLVGWFGIAGGLFRMFATGLALQSARDPHTALVLEIVLLAVGVFLTFKAYSGNGEKPAGN